MAKTNVTTSCMLRHSEKLTTGKNRRANTESKMHISPPSFRTPFFSRACLFDELRDMREKPYLSYKEKSAATTADHWNGKPLKHSVMVIMLGNSQRRK